MIFSQYYFRIRSPNVCVQILPPKMGLPKSGMTVLRAAARARADRAMVADEMDAEAVAREAAGEAAIASAFARAMAADDAHNDRRLVAVANAVALSECAPLQAALCSPLPIAHAHTKWVSW